MRKPFKRAELFLSVSMLCAASVYTLQHTRRSERRCRPVIAGSQAEKTKNTAKSDELEK